MRIKCKLTPYVHEKKPEIEKISNQSEWLENTLVEVGNQSDTIQTLQAPAQEYRNVKRNSEEGSYTIETKFRLRYNKNPKLNPANK